MTSTTIFTTSKNLAVPRTLSLEKRRGKGRVLLDSQTIFYPDWQAQLQTVFQFVRKFFGTDLHSDFLISVNSKAVSGWSTSVPLFLLFASSITGEKLPENVYSTGCMFSPDGWISHGKFDAVQTKIDVSEALVQHFAVEDPTFLIPFSLYKYKSNKVRLCLIKSVFSALKIALPKTFEHYKSRIEELSRIELQDSFQHVLDSIPRKGDAFVLISQSQKKRYLEERIGSTLLVREENPSDPVYLYFIRESTVVFKQRYTNSEKAYAEAFHYQEVLHAEPSRI